MTIAAYIVRRTRRRSTGHVRSGHDQVVMMTRGLTTCLVVVHLIVVTSIGLIFSQPNAAIVGQGCARLLRLGVVDDGGCRGYGTLGRLH